MDIDEVKLMMERKNLIGVKLNLDSSAYSFYKSIVDKYKKGNLIRIQNTLVCIVETKVSYTKSISNQ